MSSIRSLLTSLNRKVNPISRRLGGRKFFLPRTMKEPTVRYSPVGAVLDTCKLTAKHASGRKGGCCVLPRRCKFRRLSHASACIVNHTQWPLL